MDSSTHHLPFKAEAFRVGKERLLKPNMYFALLWLKKIVRLHVVVFGVRCCITLGYQP